MSKMKSLYILSLAALICGCGFFDFEKAKSEKIIGNIYTINLNIPEDIGLYLIYRENQKPDKYLLSDFEYVKKLSGNDSVLYVSTIKDGSHLFYLIKHNKGLQIDSIITLDSLSFTKDQKFKSSYKLFVGD